MIISTFRHARDNQPAPHEVDWQGLIDLVGQHRPMPPEAKLDCPAICPAQWPPDTPRGKATVKAIHFGALDFDKLTLAELDYTLETVNGYAALLYTTWSHPQRYEANGTYSFRLFIPFTRPITPQEWPRFWPRFHQHIGGGLADDKCKDPSRIYFLPAVPAHSDPDQRIVESTPGHPLDPDKILALPEPDQTPSPQSRPIPVNQQDLEDLANRLIRRIPASAKQAARTIRDGLAGTLLAAPGNRDNVLFNLACHLAEAFPRTPAASLAQFFAPSIAAMARVPSATEAPTLNTLAEKIERKQKQYLEEQKQLEKQRQDDRSACIRRAFANKRDYPYSEDELAHFAIEAETTLQEFHRRWLIQVGATYYIFRDGSYGPPLNENEVPIAAETELSPAETANVTPWKLSDKGEPKLKSAHQLMMQYGTYAMGGAVADLNAQRSKFDATNRVLIEAPCPRRDLEPLKVPHNAPLGQWLKALAPTTDQYYQLLDWLAVAPRLNEPVAALYLDGPPGTGKTLFAEALSRLWTVNGPTPLSEVTGAFNDTLQECPLVLADEVMPNIFRQSSSGTGDLRQLIQARQHVLRRKYKPNVKIRGSLRIILASNNMHMLDSSETLTPQDVAAVAERILYIRVPEKARKVLNRLGTDTINAFVANDELARFALYLYRNRQVDRQHRFLVQGKDSALHRNLTTGRGLPSAVCHWCVSYLLSPGKLDTSGQLLVRVYNDQLLTTGRALAESWEQYPTNVKPPTAGRISRVLKGLSHGKKQLVAGNGKPTNYWPIKTENLLTWAEETGYATEDQILDALIKPTLETP